MFAADARKHTPGKNAEKENFSMRILVCDDDAAFAGQLAEKIEAIVKPQMPRSTVDCATDAALLRALPLAKYDLAFLDIDMGPLNGVDLARRLHELRPDMLLIFVTNYVEYSLQGYEVQAFRYLLKAEMPQKLERYVQQALTAYRKTRDTVRIFCDGEDVELQPQQILYAEMSARKVCLHLQGADRALLYTTATMADLADLLENHGFVRTHKSVFGQYGAHPQSAKHATVSARRNRAAGQFAHSQCRAENLYAVEEREKMGYWLGIVFSCLDVLCVAVFCDAFLERKTRGLRFVVGGAALRSIVLYRYDFRFAYFGRIADNTF